MIRNLLILGVCLAGVQLLNADEKKGSELAAEKSGEVHTKVSEAKKTSGVACYINFGKELGTSLDFLKTIGPRISNARSTPDPVELALSAQALSVAEQVTGKKASITSEAVQSEALELAKLRGISAELSALAIIIHDPMIQKDLEKLAAVSKKREMEAREALKAGEGSRELRDTLTVINHSGECLRIMVSGRFIGEVHEGETMSFFQVRDFNHVTRLDAYCEEEGHLVSHQHVHGHKHNFVWHIH